MSPYDGMKLAAALRLLLRTGRGRRRDARHPAPMPTLPEDAADALPGAGRPARLASAHPARARPPAARRCRCENESALSTTYAAVSSRQWGLRRPAQPAALSAGAEEVSRECEKRR
jgi:hypothetical protein